MPYRLILMTGSLEKEAGHMMRRTGGFYRKLALGFWLSAIAGGAFVWHLAYRAVPDQISMLENQKEEFSFSALAATLSSESAEYPWEMKAIFRGMRSL